MEMVEVKKKIVGHFKLKILYIIQVHPDFWSEYSTSSGVFTIGEVFNGNPEYCSRYQGCLSSVLNYPMYYKLKDSFQSRKSMHSIHDGIEAVSCN